MNDFKLMITGNGDFYDFALLEKFVNDFLADLKKSKEITIVSVPSLGANLLGERYAVQYGFELAEFGNPYQINKIFEAETYREMAEFSDACICFWDGQCLETKRMMDQLNDMPLNLITLNYSAGGKPTILGLCKQSDYLHICSTG